ncbi:hypothetical protein NG796_20910 [Laspinema sp. A4]|uniref:hypothetical protein n=1 Tax=Laspinema sp. D2d TaxID=2953686 RepID=UPI0021BB646C|nr:hypothetical protein [Laspinema sp. D2d]MCT7985738.1 hypothetical protein [Laspinema sp. D2d]
MMKSLSPCLDQADRLFKKSYLNLCPYPLPLKILHITTKKDTLGKHLEISRQLVEGEATKPGDRATICAFPTGKPQPLKGPNLNPNLPLK